MIPDSWSGHRQTCLVASEAAWLPAAWNGDGALTCL